MMRDLYLVLVILFSIAAYLFVGYVITWLYQRFSYKEGSYSHKYNSEYDEVAIPLFWPFILFCLVFFKLPCLCFVRIIEMDFIKGSIEKLRIFIRGY
jgi:hypothetical protein